MDKSFTNARGIPVQRVMNLLRVLADLPAREPSVVSLREAVRRLGPSLRTLRSKGYTSEGLVDVLLRFGLGSRRSTLRDYVGEFAARPRRKLRRGRGRVPGVSPRQVRLAPAEAAVVVYDERAAQ
jgi:hypothetical protein